MISNESLIERLVFIKYIYDKAVDQSKKSYPDSYISVLLFHDSVELFLALVSEYLDVGSKNQGFLDYWNIIKQSTEVEISNKKSMERLNTIRNNLKHGAIPPNESLFEEFRVNSKNFFDENTKSIFDINFSDVSLLSLVNHEIVKKNLEDAEKLLLTKDITKANNKVAIAFFLLMKHYEKEESKFGGGSLSRSGNYVGISSYEFDDIEIALDDLSYDIADIKECLKIIAMGIDYYQYQKFVINTPRVYKTPNIKQLDAELTSNSGFILKNIKDNLNENDVKFGIKFVIDSSLALQKLFP